jgi:hypothetical protein
VSVLRQPITSRCYAVTTVAGYKTISSVTLGQEASLLACCHSLPTFGIAVYKGVSTLWYRKSKIPGLATGIKKFPESFPFLVFLIHKDFLLKLRKKDEFS